MWPHARCALTPALRGATFRPHPPPPADCVKRYGMIKLAPMGGTPALAKETIVERGDRDGRDPSSRLFRRPRQKPRRFLQPGARLRIDERRQRLAHAGVISVEPCR